MLVYLYRVEGNFYLEIKGLLILKKGKEEGWKKGRKELKECY